MSRFEEQQAEADGIYHLYSTAAPKYCTTCGRKLITEVCQSRFDPMTGKPLLYEYLVCPRQNKWWSAGGHTVRFVAKVSR